MPKPLKLEETPVLAAQLIRLRGETPSDLSRATGIRMANLSVWLRGKPQTISEPRVVAILDHLGIRKGVLRADIVHFWTGQGSIDDLVDVLDTVLDAADKNAVVLYQEQGAVGDTDTLLRVPATNGDAYIRFRLRPGLNARATLLNAATLGFGSEIPIDWSPGLLPETGLDIRDLRRRLSEADPQLAAQDDAETAMAKLRSEHASASGPQILPRATKEELKQLQQVLEKTLAAGVPVSELINAIARVHGGPRL